MISIIIPAYNAADYLAQTIESVLNQTYSDFELILIDDGSTDRTHEIIRDYQCKDARIKYFYKENGGVSSARNIGLQKAVGDFVSFLDSDDLWDRRFLELMYHKLIAAGGLVCFCGYIEKRGNTEIKYPRYFEEVDILKEKLSSSSFRISTDCWLINRKFLSTEGILFVEGCHYMEDLEFFCKVLYKAGRGNIVYVPEYLTSYILRTNSLTSQQKLVLPLTVMYQNIEVLKRIYLWLQRNGAEKHLTYSRLSIKRKYINFLWDRLLLGTYQDFKTLLFAYYADAPHYFPAVSLVSIKYKIWKLAVFCAPIRYFCMVFLSPYKRIKRKRKIAKLCNKDSFKRDIS